MGSFSSSKSTSTSGPASTALPYVDRALGSVEGIVNGNQSNLDTLGASAASAYNAIAPSAFGANNFLTGAQDTAQGLANGGAAYSGYGVATPASVRAGTIDTGADRSVAGGQYLGAQPSAGLYSDIIGGSQLNGNPYLQSIIDTTNASVGTAANRQFAARGMGAGIGTPYANLLTKNLAANEGGLRYQNYNDAAQRQLAAAGASDAAFASERGLMDNASGRVLAANTSNVGNALTADTTNAANGLAADQFNQTIGLNAQQAADQTRLAALGLTPQLVAAQYAGVDPALALLNASATIPYTGASVLGSNIANLTGATNSSTSKTTGTGLGASILAGAAQGAGSAAAASDRRLKTNITKLGEMRDGLGVYDFDYIDPKYGKGRQRGVMAGEVARLRPWALGPKIDGEYLTVHYSKLERAA